MSSKKAGLVHPKWFAETENKIKTTEGKEITIVEFNHENDEAVLKTWAKHFREHYCLDELIDQQRAGHGLSRKEYLVQKVFPESSRGRGPLTRSGDFGEILVADYLEYISGYIVPRTRYAYKDRRNASPQGSDVLGFKLVNSKKRSVDDTLAVYESKAQFSKKVSENKLQEAVNDSNIDAKDNVRKGDSLTAMHNRLIYRGDNELAEVVERFLNKTDHPYTDVYGAVALFSNNLYEEAVVKETITTNHALHERLNLLIIKGEDMMALVHSLYERAANEA